MPDIDAVEMGEPVSGRHKYDDTPIDRIRHAYQAHDRSVDYILVNARGFTQGMTGVALRQALAGTASPLIEIFLSSLPARETLRSHSYYTGRPSATGSLRDRAATISGQSVP